MASRGRPPSNRTLVKRQLGLDRPVAFYPGGDSFDIPNHSGISNHPEFIQALSGYVKKTGDTMTGDLIFSGESADIRHEQELDLYPNNQTTIGLRIDDDSTNLILQALGASEITFADDIEINKDTNARFGMRSPDDATEFWITVANTTVNLNSSTRPLEFKSSDGRNFFNQASVDNNLIIRDSNGDDWTITNSALDLTVEPDTLAITNRMVVDAPIDLWPSIPTITGVTSSNNGYLYFTPTYSSNSNLTADNIMNFSPKVTLGGLLDIFNVMQASGTYTNSTTFNAATFSLFNVFPVLDTGAAGKSPPAPFVFWAHGSIRYSESSGTGTMSNVAPFTSAMEYRSTTSGGTLSVDASSFASLPAAVAQSGATLTMNNFYHYFMQDLVPSGTGTKTFTNQYGLYVPSLTGATNNYGVYVQDASTYAIFVDAGLARFDGDGTDVFELPADATANGAAQVGRIPVLIGGTTRYLYYYGS